MPARTEKNKGKKQILLEKPLKTPTSRSRTIHPLEGFCLRLQDLMNDVSSLYSALYQVSGGLYDFTLKELGIENEKEMKIQQELEKFTQGFAYAPRQKPTAVRAKPKVHRMESKRNKRKHDKACRDSKRDKGLSK